MQTANYPNLKPDRWRHQDGSSLVTADRKTGEGVATEDECVLRTTKFVCDGHRRLELWASGEEPVASAERQEVDHYVRLGSDEQALDHERPHQESR